ncbi:ArsR family transcriptional regulator [Haloplanus rubicundus]|uniref:ArsR family transcriptional regulator n=1 Tax=Haloplanus rubicundus TaxID=1547898 RepID=A0A345E6G2_9EURY|nr:winged helix-turn-helix domain-containing protein [Haloplanus rubicundus]AXG07784.1 ArsR family transcriptional regulator [Haloplanus rubicundus]AXG11202.1 ArsR family transcriptional regulator [Haloplanus rubicundus]
MSGLLPSHLERDVTPEGDGELRVLSLTDDDAERLIGSVSSETARSILTALEERPATASELADSVSTSLQNVRHHLGNLQEAGLVEVAGTRYSVKGREMKVYAPSQDSLVVVGSEADKERFLDSLDRLVGVLAVLAVGAFAVQRAFGSGVVDLGGPGTAPRVGDGVGSATGPLLGLVPPGVAFLAGGLLVVALLAAWNRYTD